MLTWCIGYFNTRAGTPSVAIFTGLMLPCTSNETTLLRLLPYEE